MSSKAYEDKPAVIPLVYSSFSNDVKINPLHFPILFVDVLETTQ